MPLAEAVLTLWRWVADATVLDQVFDEHRGRSYEKILTFPFLVYLVRDALLEFNGSGRRTIEKAEERGQLETSFRAVYGKLERLPIPVSTALLADCTARLRAIYPEPPQAQNPLPKSLDDYQIEIFDGKAIKRVAKRLKPLWGMAGGVLGGRAWPRPCTRIPMAMPTRPGSWLTWSPKCDGLPRRSGSGSATVNSVT
jgi:hypothetical protein